jgi:hypothetical protein
MESKSKKSKPKLKTVYNPLRNYKEDPRREAYDSLNPADCQTLDLFIWGGCCMHKDLNSFKGGNTEMMPEWKKLGLVGPILLANKNNPAESSRSCPAPECRTHRRSIPRSRGFYLGQRPNGGVGRHNFQ